MNTTDQIRSTVFLTDPAVVVSVGKGSCQLVGAQVILRWRRAGMNLLLFGWIGLLRSRPMRLARAGQPTPANARVSCTVDAGVRILGPAWKTMAFIASSRGRVGPTAPATLGLSGRQLANSDATAGRLQSGCSPQACRRSIVDGRARYVDSTPAARRSRRCSCRRRLTAGRQSLWQSSPTTCAEALRPTHIQPPLRDAGPVRSSVSCRPRTPRARLARRGGGARLRPRAPEPSVDQELRSSRNV
jgi:hypothetical protein